MKLYHYKSDDGEHTLTLYWMFSHYYHIPCGKGWTLASATIRLIRDILMYS